MRDLRITVSAAVWIGICCQLSPAIAAIDNFELNEHLELALRATPYRGHRELQTSRTIAERHYLAYVQTTNSQYQICKVYFLLGHLYSTGARPSRDEPVDLEIARRYFENVIESEAGSLTYSGLVARIRLAALIENPEHQLDGYADVYEHLCWINNDTIQERIPTLPPNVPREQYIEFIKQSLESLRSGVAFTLIHTARQLPDAEAKLGMLVQRFPNDLVGKLARSQLTLITNRMLQQSTLRNMNHLEAIHHVSVASNDIVPMKTSIPHNSAAMVTYCPDSVDVTSIVSTASQQDKIERLPFFNIILLSTIAVAIGIIAVVRLVFGVGWWHVEGETISRQQEGELRVFGNSSTLPSIIVHRKQ